MKKFRRFSDYKIEEYEVVRETEKQIIFISNGVECREAKVSDMTSWHDTKEEAREAMINNENIKIKNYERQIQFVKTPSKKLNYYETKTM